MLQTWPLEHVAQMISNPSAFVLKYFLTQTIDEEKASSLRINDITGPGIDVVWEQQVAPEHNHKGLDLQELVTFSNAYHQIFQIYLLRELIPVLRSAPFDQEVLFITWLAPIEDLLLMIRR